MKFVYFLFSPKAVKQVLLPDRASLTLGWARVGPSQMSWPSTL